MNSSWRTTPSTNVSDEEREKYLQVLQEETTRMMIAAMTFLILLAVVGLFGNSLVLMVYSRHFKQTSTRIFIMAIAMFDLLVNVIAIPAEIYDMFHRWDFDQPHLCKFRLTFNAHTIVTSANLLVAVAVTRYKKVCRPYGHQTSIKSAKITIAAIAIAAFVLALPCAILNGRQTKQTPREDIQGYACTINDKYVHTIWPRAYMGTFILGFLICCTMMIVLYVLIGVQAWRHSGINRVGSSTRLGKSRPTTTSETMPCDQDTDSHEVKNETFGQMILHFLTRHHKKGYNNQGEYIDIGKRKYPEAKTETTTDKFTLTDASETMLKESAVDVCDTNYDSRLSTKEQPLSTRKEDAKKFNTAQKDLTCVSKDRTIFEKINKPSYKSTFGSNTHAGTRKERTIGVTSVDSVHQNVNSDNKARKVKLSVTIPTPIEGFSRREEQMAATSRRRMTRTTIMLIAISAVYIIGFVPHLTLIFYRYSSPNFFGCMDFTGFSFYNLFLRFHFLNSASNAIIYSLCDRKFREYAWRIIKCG